MIYVVCYEENPTFNDRVKIGVSKDVKKRIKELERDFLLAAGYPPRPLHLLTTCPGNTQEEKLLHHVLWMHRVPRTTEWFRFFPLVRDAVSLMKRGFELPEIISQIEKGSKRAIRLVHIAEQKKERRLRKEAELVAKERQELHDAIRLLDAYDSMQR